MLIKYAYGQFIVLDQQQSLLCLLKVYSARKLVTTKSSLSEDGPRAQPQRAGRRAPPTQEACSSQLTAHIEV